MHRPIQVLPNALVEKIAAGEVIERPSSIVKELIENSLDAKATQVDIRLVDGGRKEITISDNGIGIPANEIFLALQSHATSKIERIDDLFQIDSYGFRGEALSSIAAVSQLGLISKTENQESGIRVQTEGGEVRLHEPCGMPTGTTLTVSNLFFNTPARKKFMRSKNTELGHIENVVRKAALSQISCSFFLKNDGEVILHLPAAQNVAERLEQLYGKEISDKLVEISAEDRGISLRGVISNSHVSFSRADEVHLFVNHRPVRDRMLQAAVLEGYRTALMERKYPLAVLELTVRPDMVDVNVHPTKAEVRFADTQPVFQIISQTLSQVLKNATLPTFEPRGEGLASLPPITPTFYSPSYSTQAHQAVAQTMAIPYGATPEKGAFASLEYLGTVDATFLVMKGPQSLYLIDQHAAHERVRFEELKEGFESRSPKTQHLLVPLTLEVTQQIESALEELKPQLSQIGFEIEPFGDKTLLIKTVPQILTTHDPRPLLADLAHAHISGEGPTAYKDNIDHILSTIACHSAVRAHDLLSNVEIDSLMDQLDHVDVSSNCPHGRPTFIKLGLSEIERLFRRK